MTVSSYLKLNLPCYKESDSTLTFDSSALNFVKHQDLIVGNVMCDYIQSLPPQLLALSPEISPIFAYQIPLGHTKVK